MSLIRLCIVLLCAVLAACSGGNKRIVKAPEVPINTHPVPVLTAAQQTAFQNAVAAVAAQQYSEAEAAFRNLLAEQPRLAGAYVNLALIARARGDSAAMPALLDKALEMNPQNIDALELHAHLAQTEGRFSQAEQYLLQAASIAPDAARVHYSLGVLYELYLQEYERAISHYEQYVELSDEEDTNTVQRWIKLLERKI